VTSFRRTAKAISLGLVVLVIAIGAVLLGFRAYRQHETGRLLEIRAPRGINEATYVRIGGIDQWVQIRGRDQSNPVLLCLHGGPGATWTPLSVLFLPWEEDFTVVQWDQRGAGKTLESTGPSVAATMSVERMAQDGIEVTEYLRAHLHKDKIILLGHSWGSILGVRMARARPDLFFAYVGTGQVSDMPRSQRMGYAMLLSRARAANDTKAVTDLEGIGPPPFSGPDSARIFFEYLEQGSPYEEKADREMEQSLGPLIGSAPNFSLWDIYNRIRGFIRVPTWELYRIMLSTDQASLGLEFQIPVFFFQGADDDVTPAALAAEYLDKIRAPVKAFVPIPAAGHFAVWSAPDVFLHELIARVRPLTEH
jgi:pimeloyl-ACP methyl ester carboxylesterase